MPLARVVELVDTGDLKSPSPQGEREFESRPGHSLLPCNHAFLWEQRRRVVPPVVREAPWPGATTASRRSCAARRPSCAGRRARGGRSSGPSPSAPRRCIPANGRASDPAWSCLLLVGWCWSIVRSPRRAASCPARARTARDGRRSGASSPDHDARAPPRHGEPTSRPRSSAKPRDGVGGGSRRRRACTPSEPRSTPPTPATPSTACRPPGGTRSRTRDAPADAPRGCRRRSSASSPTGRGHPSATPAADCGGSTSPPRGSAGRANRRSPARAPSIRPAGAHSTRRGGPSPTSAGRSPRPGLPPARGSGSGARHARHAAI